MNVYIAGPMRGLPQWNFEAFDRAERRWCAAGHRPFSPAAMDRALGYGSDSEVTPEHLRHVAAVDVASILASDAIALLPGWEKSSGATFELALAQFLGLEIYDADTLERITPPVTPWKYANFLPLFRERKMTNALTLQKCE